MASKLAIQQSKEPAQDGTLIVVTPRDAEWKYVSFHVGRLRPNQVVKSNTLGEEVGLVVLSGTVTVRSSAGVWENIGERASVFEGSPYVVYLPPRTDFALEGITQCEIARCGAVAQEGAAARLITPEEIAEETRGEGNAQRYVRHLLEADRPAEHLFLVEVITPSGNWSSYPPHKHDVDDPPRETYLEETYYHKVKPVQGFGFQRVYTADRSLDEVMLVEDGTLVLVPRGYHTVSVAPGYDLYYLNVMAGPVREWHFNNDPAHAWVSDQWRPYGG